MGAMNFLILLFFCISEIHCNELDGILILGGQTHHYHDTDIDYFTPSNNKSKFLPHCKLRTARISAASAALGKYEAIIMGGSIMIKGVLTPVSSSEIINMKTEQVSDGPSMTGPRRHAAAAVYKGDIWICGGSDGKNVLKTCETLKQADKNAKWKKAKSMIHARERGMLVTAGKNLYSIGGKNITDAVMSVERYNLITKEWEHALDLPKWGDPKARVDAQAAALGEYIFVCGGGGVLGKPHRSCIWIVKNKFLWWAPNLIVNRSRFAMVEYHGRLYAFGGQNVVNQSKSITNTIEEYNPKMRKWNIVGNMSSPRADMSAVLVSQPIAYTTMSDLSPTTSMRDYNGASACGSLDVYCFLQQYLSILSKKS